MVERSQHADGNRLRDRANLVRHTRPDAYSLHQFFTVAFSVFVIADLVHGDAALGRYLLQ